MSRATLAGAFRVRFVAVLTAMYVAVVLAVTLYPTTVDKGLDPYINRLLNAAHNHGIPSFVNYNFIEFSANIVFFVPVGFLGGLLLPNRVSSPADVVANTTGTIIGCLVAVAVRMLILHRDTLVIRDVLNGRRAEDGLPIRN